MNHADTAAPISALVVDDEPQMQRLLTFALESNGYRVSSASGGKQALIAASQHRHDLILLDLGLPDINGAEVLKELRSWTQTPVIVLSVQDREAEKIEALDNGADDYVTKPFKTGELLARMRAALRHANKGQSEEPIFRAGDVEVNLAARRVTKNGQPVKLTATEYVLLRLFIQHAGRVLTHWQILREVWGPNHEDKTAYLRVYIARLREKLENDPACPKLFLTESGVGYRLAEGLCEK
jgi:two-component system KDP operon response regulator KdpE